MNAPSKPFVISRTIGAPREKVFAAWVDVDKIKHWLGPKGAGIVKATTDLKPGGVFHYCMRGQDGNEAWGKWTFEEIKKPESIIAIIAFSDEKGGITAHPFEPNWPRETISAVSFREQGGKTTVLIEWLPLNPTDAERKVFDENHASMNTGWGASLDRLEQYLNAAAQPALPMTA